MGCFYCGKTISWARRRSDQDFCSDRHRARYHELVRLGLTRIAGRKRSDRGAPPKPAPHAIGSAASFWSALLDQYAQ